MANFLPHRFLFVYQLNALMSYLYELECPGLCVSPQQGHVIVALVVDHTAVAIIVGIVRADVFAVVAAAKQVPKRRKRSHQRDVLLAVWPQFTAAMMVRTLRASGCSGAMLLLLSTAEQRVSGPPPRPLSLHLLQQQQMELQQACLQDRCCGHDEPRSHQRSRRG
jgi:hypothetical protein